jgi:hypothetical protein
LPMFKEGVLQHFRRRYGNVHLLTGVVLLTLRKKVYYLNLL